MQLFNLRWEEFIERLKRIRVSLKTFKRFEMMRTNRFQPFKGFEDKWILTKLWPRRAYKVWWPGCLIRDKWVGEDFAFCFSFYFLSFFHLRSTLFCFLFFFFLFSFLFSSAFHFNLIWYYQSFFVFQDFPNNCPVGNTFHDCTNRRKTFL